MTLPNQQFQVQWVIHRFGDPFSFAAFGQPTVRPPDLWDEVWRTVGLPHQEVPLDATGGGLRDIIWAEVERLVQGPTLPTLPNGRPMAVQVTAQHLVRNVSNGSAGSASSGSRLLDLTTLTRNWEIHRSGDANFYRNHEETVAVSRLSDAGRRALHILDQLAQRNVAQRYERRLEELATSEGWVLPPLPRTLSTFISYRRPRLDLAQRLSGAFASFGSGAHFVPFLDVHDTKLGHWAKQYLSAIEQSDLFVVLCTEDYAVEGSFSRVELEHAVSIGKPIAVVVPGIPVERRPAAWHEHLHALDACILDREEDLISGNRVVERYLTTCVTSLRSGGAS